MIILESERLLFRQHTDDDLESYCAMEMDAEVRRYVGGYLRTRQDAETRFRAGALRPGIGPLGIWATTLKADGSYVGRCGLYPHVLPGEIVAVGEAVLSFYIARPYWRLGFATEAAAALIRFGWEELQLLRIVATVQDENCVSIHILEKFRFALIRTERGKRSFLHYRLNNPCASL